MTLAKPLAVVALAICCCAATLESRQQGPVDPWREFPSYEQPLAAIVRRGADVKRAEREWRDSPAAAATIQHLFEVNRIDDAIDGVRLALGGNTDAVVAVLGIVGEKATQFQRDSTHGYADKVKAIIEPVRSRLTDLAPEDRARVARALLSVDAALNRGGTNPRWEDRVKEFVDKYAGTKTGLLAQVDLIEAGVGTLTQIELFDRFWREHPASEAGAKALYMKGFELHVNVAVTNIERAGTDPTPRLLQVLDIVDELESGRYPDCPWVRQAPQLVSGFFVSTRLPITYAPGNIDRMIDGYQRFVRKHFDPNSKEDPLDSNIGYVITTKIADLGQAKGDRTGAVERSLADLEEHGADISAVALFRAHYLARQATGGPGADRQALVESAERALRTLIDADAGYPSRKAAALLAGFRFYRRDYTGALAAFDAYAKRYPASPYAWVAAVRAAQCVQLMGDDEAAAVKLEKVAQSAARDPLARVVSSAFAGQAFDASGQFDRSLIEYRNALNAWDPDFGADLTSNPQQSPVPAPATGASTNPVRLTPEYLTSRVTSLERHASSRAGALIERGRWQIEHRRFADAQATLEAAVKEAGSADLLEARTQLHRTALEMAVDTAAIEGATKNESTALVAFDRLTHEPFDAVVGAAGLAKATLLFKKGAAAEADAAMTSVLDAWLTAQQQVRSRPPESPVAADVAEIRRIVFQPTGALALLRGNWNAFQFPTALSYTVVNPEIRVKIAGGSATRMSVYQTLPGFERTLFLNADDLSIVSRLMVTMGGTQKYAWVDVMATPNQPAGAALTVMEFWNRYFPMRQGHWGGWVIETYPTISEIDFLDDVRSKASVFVTIGYSGATVVMEKVGGRWTAVRLVDQWIT